MTEYVKLEVDDAYVATVRIDRTPVNALNAVAGQLQSAGFRQVTVLSGPPPILEEATAQSAA